MRGRWTRPGSPLPSSHLIASGLLDTWKTRCGRLIQTSDLLDVTDEPPGNQKTCERCAVLNERDG